jgi:hypothetical protein
VGALNSDLLSFIDATLDEEARSRRAFGSKVGTGFTGAVLALTRRAPRGIQQPMLFQEHPENIRGLRGTDPRL